MSPEPTPDTRPRWPTPPAETSPAPKLLFTIRRAEVRDAAGIAKVECRAWRATYAGQLPDSYLSRFEPRQRQQAWAWQLAEEPSSTLVAAHDGKVVGYARYLPCPDRDLRSMQASELRELYVDPDSQGMGVGTQLVSQVWQRQKQLSVEFSVVWVLETNAKARSFYERMGYALDGAQKQDEFDDEEVTVVRYRRALLP